MVYKGRLVILVKFYFPVELMSDNSNSGIFNSHLKWVAFMGNNTEKNDFFTNKSGVNGNGCNSHSQNEWVFWAISDNSDKSLPGSGQFHAAEHHQHEEVGVGGHPAAIAGAVPNIWIQK